MRRPSQTLSRPRDSPSCIARIGSSSGPAGRQLKPEQAGKDQVRHHGQQEAGDQITDKRATAEGAGVGNQEDWRRNEEAERLEEGDEPRQQRRHGSERRPVGCWPTRARRLTSAQQERDAADQETHPNDDRKDAWADRGIAGAFA
jgi:hypothetical protein